ncbi:hypothetical protein [Nocardioides acrostichi]|uniref:Uncharacterized protein n=1 Tax=Nocardioides acrostichi TaxID=2784339 RepID=A0A930UZ88_9ACTN|nr:hypothetical protein [Nocardioides acrostichi]MBF4163618.1 hypothetical protein [Nocardioides acrostichi]
MTTPGPVGASGSLIPFPDRSANAGEADRRASARVERAQHALGVACGRADRVKLLRAELDAGRADGVGICLVRALATPGAATASDLVEARERQRDVLARHAEVVADEVPWLGEVLEPVAAASGEDDGELPAALAGYVSLLDRLDVVVATLVRTAWQRRLDLTRAEETLRRLPEADAAAMVEVAVAPRLYAESGQVHERVAAVLDRLTDQVCSPGVSSGPVETPGSSAPGRLQLELRLEWARLALSRASHEGCSEVEVRAAQERVDLLLAAREAASSPDRRGGRDGARATPRSERDLHRSLLDFLR